VLLSGRRARERGLLAAARRGGQPVQQDERRHAARDAHGPPAVERREAGVRAAEVRDPIRQAGQRHRPPRDAPDRAAFVESQRGSVRIHSSTDLHR